MAKSDRNVVKAAATFREVLRDATSFDTKLDTTNEGLAVALEQLVAAAGGDMARVGPEQQQIFGDALAKWLTEMIEEL